MNPQEHLEHARKAAQNSVQQYASAGLRASASVAVIGAGTMGSGIAMALVQIGSSVVLIDANQEALDAGKARIVRAHDSAQQRGKLTQVSREALEALLTYSLEISSVSNCDIVIEAVFEDLALKQQIFSQLDRLAKPGAVLATNTSGLDINVIANATKRPADVVGAHFFSPAHIQRLLEIVSTEHTAPDVIATLGSLGQRMGKTVVIARVYPGFIGNALFRTYQREAHFLLEEGALPHEVDAALTQFGYAMGLFAVHDMAGNDVGYQTRKAMVATRAKDRRWCDLILGLTEQGRVGQKVGKGWYRYALPDRTPLRDPEVEAWITQDSRARGFARQSLSANEIVERCVLSMVNEGARLLELGIAQRASDIDLVYATGYGFPAQHAGPMFYADTLGLKHVLARVQAMHEQHGIWWQPSALLTQLASQNKSFAQWDAGR
jgi:3-hydroxyacyl-CoA dehydrogenase